MKRTKFNDAKKQRAFDEMQAKEYIQMIRKIAWSFHSTTGLSFEDLFGEALLYFYNAFTKYDETKGMKLTSWAWHITQNRMIDYCKKQIHRHTSSLDDLLIQPSTTLKHSFELTELVGTNEDMLFVAQMILDDEERYEVRNAKELITKDLVYLGWKYNRIWQTLRNLKKTIRYGY